MFTCSTRLRNLSEIEQSMAKLMTILHISSTTFKGTYGNKGYMARTVLSSEDDKEPSSPSLSYISISCFISNRSQLETSGVDN